MHPHPDALARLMPILIWAHSKKHEEKNLQGQWHSAWNTLTATLYPDEDDDLRIMEHAVHDAIGIPTDDCQCEVCHA